MSLEVFRRIQTGIETTRGTKVAATRRLLGKLTMDPDITYHRPEDERGSLASFYRQTKMAQRGKISFEGGATFEQIIDLLAMSIKGGVTAVVAVAADWPTGTTTVPVAAVLAVLKKWVFAPNLVTRSNPNAFTFEYGDNTRQFASPFCMVENLELSGALDEVMNIRADIFSRYPEIRVWTGSIAQEPVVDIATNNGALFITDTWAKLQATDISSYKKADLVSGTNFKLETGLMPVKHMDGTVEFTNFSEGRRHVELGIEYVSSTDGQTEYDKMYSGDQRAIRLRFTGSDSQFVNFDIVGRYMGAPSFFGAKDGENLFELTLASFDDGAAHDFAVTVVNKESALAGV